MTRVELEKVLLVLAKIKEPDARVLEAICIVNKNIEMFNSKRGQMKDNYEVDWGGL